MEKIIVVSSNNSPDYLFYSPYIKHAWNSYGWKVAVVITHDVDPINVVGDYIIQLPDITGLRTETQAQGGRLYAANYLPVDSLVMTSDMDLLPLFDYWHPKEDEITVYGHDLTWRSFYPMGYICMTCAKWKEVMNLKFNTKDEFLRDANETQIAFAPDWDSWWNFDWDLITKRLKPMHDSIKFIDRGQINIAGASLAYGRVDRFNWEETMKQDHWIDAHCENNNVRHPDKLAKFLKVFEKVYGKL